MIIGTLLAIYLALCAYLATTELRAKYKDQSYLTPSEVIESVCSFWAIGIGLLLLVIGLVVFYSGMGIFYTYIFIKKFLSFKLKNNFWHSAKYITIFIVLTSLIFGPVAQNPKAFFILQAISWLLVMFGAALLNRKGNNA